MSFYQPTVWGQEASKEEEGEAREVHSYSTRHSVTRCKVFARYTAGWSQGLKVVTLVILAWHFTSELLVLE